MMQGGWEGVVGGGGWGGGWAVSVTGCSRLLKQEKKQLQLMMYFFL